MIPRHSEPLLRQLSLQFKAVAIIGPRQSGKTTLARYTFPEKKYVNLENPDVYLYAQEDPRGFFAQFPEGAILDEAQRTPWLFSYLQQILDESTAPGKFIITGSNNFLLQESITQSLAGRVAILELLPFSVYELPDQVRPNIASTLLQGFYPPVFDQNVDPVLWFANYTRTYLERDVRQIKNISNLSTFARFLRLCAGRTGQLLNQNSLAIETGVDGKTISAWISVLESSFILFRLQPYHSNFNKRVVKMPKLYFYDTGLVCSLLGVKAADQLPYHPLFGALFENMVIAEMKKYLNNHTGSADLWFWRDSAGHELDVVLESGSSLYPVEIKSGATITSEYFKNLIWWEKLTGINHGYVLYGGDQSQNRSSGVTVLPWVQLDTMIQKTGLV